MNRNSVEYDLKKAEFILEAVKHYTACVVADEHDTEKLAEKVIFAGDVLESCIYSVEYSRKQVVA